MKKIKSYDKTMAHFLVTPDEMRLIQKSVLLEEEFERPLKRALFSEKIADQYCICVDLTILDDILCYAQGTRHQFKEKKFRTNIKHLVEQIREAFFNPLADQKEKAEAVALAAKEVIEQEERLQDPAYHKLLKNISPLAEQLKALGPEPRYEFLKCRYCGAHETDTFEGERLLLNKDKLPTGYQEMEILERHLESYEDDQYEGCIITCKFMCLACQMVQTAVCEDLFQKIDD